MPRLKQSKTQEQTTPETKRGISPNLQKVVDALNSKFGENTVTVGVPDRRATVKRIPTGSITLDLELGGGIPEGRFIEISGNESSSKTTQVCHIIREAQKLGHTVVFADVEGTSDLPYFKSLGIDTDSMIYLRPDSMEEATETILQFQKSGEVTFGVIDSIASMIPNKEAASKMDETVRMGIPQQLLGEFFRKWQANNNRLDREGKTPFTLIGVNQLREKIGAYGDPEYSPGGNAKKFFASVSIRLRKGDWIVEGKGDSKTIVGQVVKFKIEKNKLGARMRTGEFDFYIRDNAVGIKPLYNDNEKEIIILAVNWGIVERRGAWFYYSDKKYLGVDPLISELKKNPEMVQDIKREIFSLSSKVV